MSKKYYIKTVLRPPTPRSEKLRTFGGTMISGTHSPGGTTCTCDSLFELVNIGTETNPEWAIHAKFGLYSDSFLSTKGVSPYTDTSGGSSSSSVNWSDIKGKPTTVGGYGITDAVTIAGPQYITGTKRFAEAIEIGGSGNNPHGSVSYNTTSSTMVVSATHVSVSAGGVASVSGSTVRISGTNVEISGGSTTISCGTVKMSGGVVEIFGTAGMSIGRSNKANLTFTQTGASTYQAELNCPLIVEGKPVLTEVVLPVLQYHLEAYIRKDYKIAEYILGLLVDGVEQSLPDGCALRFFRLVRSNSTLQDSADNNRGRHHRLRQWICPFDTNLNEEMMPLTPVEYHPSANKWSTPLAVAAATTGTPTTLADDLFRKFGGVVTLDSSGFAFQISLRHGGKAKKCYVDSPHRLRASAQYGVALVRDGIQVSNIAPFRLVMELMPPKNGVLTECTSNIYLTK